MFSRKSKSRGEATAIGFGFFFILSLSAGLLWTADYVSDRNQTDIFRREITNTIYIQSRDYDLTPGFSFNLPTKHGEWDVDYNYTYDSGKVKSICVDGSNHIRNINTNFCVYNGGKWW